MSIFIHSTKHTKHTFRNLYVCMVTHIGKSMDQPGKVASPARGQLDRKIEYFPVRVRA